MYSIALTGSESKMHFSFLDLQVDFVHPLNCY